MGAETVPTTIVILSFNSARNANGNGKNIKCSRGNSTGNGKKARTNSSNNSDGSSTGGNNTTDNNDNNKRQLPRQ